LRKAWKEMGFSTKFLSEARARRIVAVARIILVTGGAIIISIFIAGLMSFLALSALDMIMLLALGVAMIFTGIFNMNLMELVV
jgi:predicted phage tail protein